VISDFTPGTNEAVRLPAAFAQERLWFLDRMRPGTAVYNMPVSVRLRARVSRAVTERCLAELVRRHETLRTTFAVDGQCLVQVVSPPHPLTLAFTDLRRYPRHQREARLGELLSAEARRPFDLERGPLLRATLVRIAEADHVLCLVLHHIIADAWSVETLMGEIGVLYAAFDAGAPSPLKPLAVQYADWAQWQRERLRGAALDAEVAFWRRRLDGAPTVLELPSDRLRQEQPSYAGGVERFVVAANLAGRLRALAQDHGCTLYMVLLAAFAATLGRYAGQSDLLIGSPVALRNDPDIEPLIGLFVNTAVLRIDLRGTPTVADLLGRARAAALDVHAHGEMPFDRLIEALQPPRGASRPPLVQVLFAHQASAAAAAATGQASPRSLTAPSPPPSTGTSKFDLSLLTTEAGGELAGTWEYATDLFDAARIRRIGDHFTRLLEAFTAAPGAAVCGLQGLSPADERELAAFEAGSPRSPGDPGGARRPACIHERVAEMARRTPDAIAVEAEGETLSYAALVARAADLAGRLRMQGVGPEVRVGLCTRRSADLVVGALAILQAGGAYVPLDPTHPRHRQAFIVDDAALIWVVTEEALVPRLPDGVRPLCIDTPGNGGAGSPPPRVSPDNLAYVLYTSGTTGRPKGVGVTHGCVAALLDWASAAFEPGMLARVLASTSVCFDLSVFEFFLPLTVGGTVVVVENVLRLASPGAPDVTLINTVPSAMRELVRLWRPQAALRAVNLAGEPLTRDLVQRLYERAPGVTVFNLYGPTETTVYSTDARLEPADRAAVPIGRPVAGTSVYVLDNRLRRVPVGVAGELYIGGAGVSRGYLGRPGRTAERFLPDPFASRPGARMYRTGDIVCWRPNGDLEFRGRADHQVKLRGYRIEPAEIESALRGCPGVRDATVVLRDTQSGHPRLVAYVAAEAPAPTPAELDTAVRRTLPDYMAPSQFVLLGSLPRTATGKVDRAALPAPDPVEARGPRRAPAPGAEAALCELFAEALGASDFDPDGDFFAAGGHSLLAAGVVARAADFLGVDLPLSSIFQHPTPATLTAFATAASPAVAPRRRAGVVAGGALPLSFAQEGIWFYDRLRPGTSLYILPVTLQISGPLAPADLQLSLDRIVARHQTLRMRFETVEGVPVQRVVEDAAVRLVIHDLSGLPPDEARARSRRILERESRRPFDLHRPPLLRACLVRLAPQEHIVALVVHHIAADGRSVDVLLRELTAFNAAASQNREPTLPDLPVQYSDYVLWQRETMSAFPLGERVARYHRDHLAGAPVLLELPTDFSRPAAPSFRGDVVPFSVGAAVDARLVAVAAAAGLTPHMAYLAVFVALLHQYSGQPDVVIGIPMANRGRPEWRNLIGLFTNTVPVRVNLAGAPTVAALLDRVRDAAIAAYAMEDVPFDRLVQELSPSRDPSYHPIFQVMFGYQELGADRSQASREILATTATAKFDLSIHLSRAGDEVFGFLEYATDLFERASMERVAGRYCRLVEALAAAPDGPLGDVLPLDDPERAWCASRRLQPTPGRPSSSEVDRSLPAGRDDSLAQPRTEVEHQIAEIWAEVLGHCAFGMTQNFFEVGGHSLAAMCVMARVADLWGVDIPFDRIFTTPTVEALARVVESASSPADGEAVDTPGSLPPLRRVERRSNLPLSFAQERLWFLDQLAPGLPVYNIPFSVPLPGTVDVGALERALDRLGERHECLRARFLAGEAGPEQVLDPVLATELRVTDLSRTDVSTRQAEAERLLSLQARRYFDLSRRPLLHAHLLCLGPGQNVLLLTVHHIVADALSIDILRRDLTALYEAERTGAPDGLPELPVQYADFAAWQRGWLKGDRLTAEQAYWRGRLAGAPALLTLPTDRPRPAVQSYRGEQFPLTLGGETSAAVRRLARDEQATPFMMLLSVFVAVLGRWGGATDVVVGTPIIGRPRRELEELVGFFSNTLPIRVAVDPRQTFRTLLRRVRAVMIEAFAHQDLPFEAMVQELRVERTLAYNPLFQVMFAFQRPTDGSLATPQPPAPTAARRTGSGTAKFDLTLFLVDAEEFHGAVEYRTDLFEAVTVERFASHLCAAAGAASGSPDKPLAELLGPSSTDLAAIVRWNDTTVRFDGGDSLAGALCAAQAARTPSAPAVSARMERWSYADLLRYAEDLAARLRALGVGPDCRVAVCAEPSPRLVAAMVGVWLAGGACVSLDPSYPAERLAFMVADCGARWLVGTCPTPEVAPGLSVLPLALRPGAEPAGPLSSADLALPPAGSPDQLAYVVYTSGSTGRPKGVAVPHRALVNLILWQRGRSWARRTLQFASPSFDVFFQELLLCLATGGELVIATPDERRDPARLIELCRERRVERLFLPFVALRGLAEVGVHRAPLLDLREVITAGEQLQATPALRRWFADHPACRLLNQYGPSETHVVTEEPLPADPQGWSELPPIGRAIANVRPYVLDEELGHLPVGVPGDLYLGGVGLARGYLDRPALSAERFLPDPYAARQGSRMYRTGDRARWLPDGRLEFLGRIDDQVKVRGFRVEVGEVEACLAKLPGVRQAVVLALPDDGDRRLVAYVLADGPSAEPETLRAALRRELPEPFVPSALVLVEDFPRTPSGKVDRRALSAVQCKPGAAHEPATDLERAVAQTWCEVLGLERVDRDDDFFSLGGHSLTATRVAVRLHERLGSDVPVSWLFEHPTVGRLAAALAATGSAGPSAPVASAIVPVARDGSALPTSFAQERLWFLDRVAPNNPAYTLVSGSTFPPSLSVDLLGHCLDELVRRHEALRTVFREVDGRPVQVITPAASAAMEFIDLTYLPAHEIDAEVREWVEDEGRRSFDLAAGPLFRAKLLGLGPSGYVLLLAMHHIISDAWSLRILQRDLAAIYEALERGAPPLPPLRIQYADFANWQRVRLNGARLEELVSFWRAHLADAPHRLELPTDRPRAQSRTFRGGIHPFELEAELVEGLHALARDEGATLFMTVLALYLEMLHRYAQQDDLLVGTPIGVRPEVGTEDVVGLFVNTLVLRGDLSGAPSFRGLLRRVREETLAALAHAELPFERLVEELQPTRDLGFNPLVQVAFGLQHAPDGRITTARPAGEARADDAGPMSGNGTSKFELSLVLTEAEGRLSAVFEYDRDLFDPGTVGRMQQHFVTLARRAVLDPDGCLSEWDLVTAAESRDAIGHWERGPQTSAEVGLPELVAQHARRTPTTLAAEGPDGALDYAEFDARADRLAGALRAMGVTGEVRVGVCLGNSVYLPVSLLAVWRAGGAYVPLDPALPRARLESLLNDAGVRVLVTDRAGAERFSGCGARVLLAHEFGDGPAPADGAAPHPDQLAYVIYTSGSTGRPKGVMATHRGVGALIAAAAHALRVAPGDRVLKFAPPSFDASVFEMVLTLAAGATLCLEPADAVLPGPDLASVLQRRQITMVTLPPSSLGVLPDADLPALRLLFVAGEVCPAELVARWARGRQMVNGYGPTEATVWATYAACVPDGRPPPIGRPVANALVHILDRRLRPVPVGVPGELCVGGPIVARGYLRRPGLTAAHFIPDPWGSPGARMYRTGDLARWRPDGGIDFLGRLDGQIKLRGVRIEPGEIEASIAALPGVAFCVVVRREDRPGNPALVAYVVPAPPAVLDGSAIRRALQEQLPRSLVPAQVVVCAELPRTASGKIDRNALPPPPTVGTPSAPQSSLEDAVCRICTEILGVPADRSANFFELGGHSLLLTRVLARIRDDLGIDVPIRRMFEVSSLAEFCEGLDGYPHEPSSKITRLPRTPVPAGAGPVSGRFDPDAAKGQHTTRIRFSEKEAHE
jgi:amino acid adenylation domain-containing protein